MNDNYLIHYGVLGMKWGVRRERSKSLGSARKQYKENKKAIDYNSQFFGNKYKKTNQKANRKNYKEVKKRIKTTAKNDYKQKKAESEKSKTTYRQRKKMAKNLYQKEIDAYSNVYMKYNTDSRRGEARANAAGLKAKKKVTDAFIKKHGTKLYKKMKREAIFRESVKAGALMVGGLAAYSWAVNKK